jgi:hypothetical protein
MSGRRFTDGGGKPWTVSDHCTVLNPNQPATPIESDDDRRR